MAVSGPSLSPQEGAIVGALVRHWTQWQITVRLKALSTLLTIWQSSFVVSGILPHNGRNIPLRELGDLVNKTYNFAPSFCYFVSKYIGDVLTRDYDKDTIDLSDIDVHNGIEHDASLFRTLSLVNHIAPNLSTFLFDRSWCYIRTGPIQDRIWPRWWVPLVCIGYRQYSHYEGHVCSIDQTSVGLKV